MLEVRPVRTRRDRRRFLRFPDTLYRGHPYWVRPLAAERNLAVDTRNNPFYQRAELELFLALRRGKPVGRMAAILNHAHNDYHREQTGFFGFFEAIDDVEATRGLLEAVESWHGARGMRQLRGPVNPSMDAECGVLIEGFDSSPAILMPYNPPYYAEHLEACALQKVIDLLAYELQDRRLQDLLRQRDHLEKIVRRLQKKKPSLRIRQFDRRHFHRDALILREVFDEARHRNYGYVPSTDEEYQVLIRKMRQMLDPELVFILEWEGRPVGCVVGVPDWNIALKRSARTPGPLRLLNLALQRKHIDNLRVIAVAIAEEFRRTGILSFLILQILDTGIRKGYRRAEMSWIAEDNTVNIATLERTFDVKPFKRYRIYGKPIGSGS